MIEKVTDFVQKYQHTNKCLCNHILDTYILSPETDKLTLSETGMTQKNK